MKQIFTFLAAVLLTATTYAQVGIGTTTPATSAALDITSTTKGLLIPRMTNAQRQAISSPVAGLMVFVTDFDGGRFMFYDGTEWGTLSFAETRPEAPTITGVTSSNSQQATVSYTAPSSNGGSVITSYTATSNPGNITATVNQSGSGDITVTGLTNGTAYTFTVTATNAIGTSTASAPSGSVAPATIPDAPTITGVTSSISQQATVSYTAPSSNGGSVITSYTATSNPGGITGTISQAGSGSITVTGLTNGTAYTFTVTATNSAGTSSPSAASNAVTIYPDYSPAALLSGDQKNIINATNSLKAIGLTDWSELIGFTDNGGSLYAEGYSTDDYAIRETKTYLMFSENNNWNSSTKVFLAEYNYNANSNFDEVSFSNGSSAAKTENVTISSNQKYISYTNSGTNYTVNMTIADRTLPLYLDLEQYYSNARGNQVNITFDDPNDAELVFYNNGGGNYGNNTNGSSTIQFSTNIMTPALAYIDEILANGSPSRVLWFSGDMIHTLYDSCGYPFTNDFDPNYPAPQFILKTINGYDTHVSDITNGNESFIAKYMNCNTIYQSEPY